MTPNTTKTPAAFSANASGLYTPDDSGVLTPEALAWAQTAPWDKNSPELPWFPEDGIPGQTVVFPLRLTHDVSIDAELATRWLEFNISNRPERPRRIRDYNRLMRAGHWSTNGEAIKFSRTGRLLDGQQRLNAIKLTEGSGLSVTIEVSWGIPDEAQDTMDQPLLRRGSDQLSLHGIDTGNNRLATGAIRLYRKWTQGHLFAGVHGAFYNNELVEWVRENPEVLSNLTRYIGMGASRIPTKPSPGLGVLIGLREVDALAADDFARGLITGANLQPGDPVLTLRDRLMHLRSSRGAASLTDRELVFYYISSWNHWRKGNTLERLVLPHGGLTFDNFPVPN